MELSNFSTFILTLSGPPPTANTSATYNLSAAIQGITKVQLDYSILNTFVTKMYKTTLNWGTSAYGLSAFSVSSNYDNSTTTQFNSAALVHIYAPSLSSTSTSSARFAVYFENGAVYSYNTLFYILAENLIDLDLNILNIQSVQNQGHQILNVQSNQRNVLFNLTN